ncbi:ras-related protein Rap-2a [Galendromus occidentalis]|uniref:Ras-related protein Rap-2a n=1 Tax=Galendromus occidentalis TaxID=34638 RepID=A0AAJ6VY57_9ACAR|nr:ras-related protein Rap-2a [Galendromus occidentalis]
MKRFGHHNNNHHQSHEDDLHKKESSERASPQDDVVAELPCSPAVNRKSKFSYNPLRGARHSFSIDYGDVLPVPRGNRKPHNTLTGTPTGRTPSNGQPDKAQYRVVFLGGAKVGKSAIIHQFLYEKFLHDYSATVEEFHRGEYDVGLESKVSLDILDTGGSCEFPAMRRLAIGSGDAFVLVYAVDNESSYDTVRTLRDDILQLRQSDKTSPPIVVVANKTDLPSEKHIESIASSMVEPVVCMDWEHAFVECSAKDNADVVHVFQELLALSPLKKQTPPARQAGFRRMSLPVTSLSDQLGSLSLTKSPGHKKKRDSCHVS